MIAAAVSISLLSLSLFAPIVCKILGIDPNTLNLDVLDSSGIPDLPNGGISLDHPLGLIPGTGRDLLAQLLYGSRISFMVAILTTFTSLTIGLFVGIIGGYFRGRVDSTLGRFTDFLLAFPAFFMIVALSEPMVARIESTGIAEGNGARVLFLVFFLSFFGWPGFSRLIRSQVLSLRERDFVTAARSRGRLFILRPWRPTASIDLGNLAVQRFPLCHSHARLFLDYCRLIGHRGPCL